MAEDPNNPEELAGLYRVAIRQHASAPIGFRQPVDATHRHEEYNPLCGDRIEILLRLGEDIIEAAAFDGEGCAICMASASLLCSLAPGHAANDLLHWGEALREALEAPDHPISEGALGAAVGAAVGPAVGAASAAMGLKKSRLKPLLQGVPHSRRKPRPPSATEHAELPGELRALLGVRPYPSRIRCATLPWSAAQRALSDLEPPTP